MRKIIYLFSAFCTLAISAGAHIKLPAIVSNDMVLQQKTKVLVWGWSTQNGPVLVTTGWNHKTYPTRTDTHGRWEVKVATPAAGGPYDITFNDGEPLTIKNILIGEVWLCSGQSNMEMPVKGYNKQPVLHSRELITAANSRPDIRMFRVPKVVSAVPEADCKGQWFRTDSETVKNFSAIAYQYALNLQAKLHVPIGIIETYWGGTAIQSWMAESTLKGIDGVQLFTRLDTIKDPEKDPGASPSILYNSMINPIAGYTIKGFIWYQGESNRWDAPLYRKLMPVMVAEWRTLWHNSKLPFYYVQIAPYGYSGRNDYFSAELREVQLQIADIIPHSGMVVSIDAGMQRYIHPPDKTVLSDRLATLAFTQTYHLPGYHYDSPVLDKVLIKDKKMLLYFSNAGQGLVLKGGDTGTFEVAGADNVFHVAKAVLKNSKIIELSSPDVEKPVAARYAFKNWVQGNIYNSLGLPASSFRTDHW